MSWPDISMAMHRKAPRPDTEVESRELRMENKLQREIIMQMRRIKVNQKNKEASREKKHAEEVQQMEEHISTLETGNAKLKRHNNRLRRKMSKLKKQIHLQKGERPLVNLTKHQRRNALPGETFIYSHQAIFFLIYYLCQKLVFGVVGQSLNQSVSGIMQKLLKS